MVDNWEIFVTDVRGKTSVNLTRNPCSEFSPDWSRTGRWLAFVCGYGRSAGVYVMRVDRTVRRRVFPPRSGERFFGGPVWAPDDRRLAVPRETGIWVVDVDGSDLLRVSRGADESPTWSADGRWIAYERKRRGGSDIFKMRANGTQDRRIARDATGPAWSPDGRSIAVLKQGSIWTMNPDGGSVRRVLRARKGDPTDLAWSPDSRYLAYEVSSGNDAGVYLIALDSTFRRLVVGVADGGGIAWGPGLADASVHHQESIGGKGIREWAAHAVSSAALRPHR